MVGNITGLYPNIYKQDRRQQCTPVESDRRSGLERRQVPRPVLDPALKQDIDKTKNIFAALSPITPIRRLSSLPDNIKDGNYTRAAGLLGLAAANFPEDSRDIKSAFLQVFQGIKPLYSHKEYQAPFSFFRGTLLEPLTNVNSKLGEKLYNFDKSLFDTKLGQKLTRLFKVEVEDTIFTGKFDSNSTPILANKLKGSRIGKLAGRSLLRIPVMSVIILSVLELPSIVKAFKGKKELKSNLAEGTKQITKSTVNVASILSGIGIFGAMLAGKGPVGSLIGMGLGSIVGSYTSKSYSKFIDKQIKTS